MLFIPNDDSDDDNASENERSVIVHRPVQAGVFSFHNGTEEALFIEIQNRLKSSEDKTPSFILGVVDSFCYSRHWMMNIGDMKGAFLDDALLLTQSQVLGGGEMVLEIGSYCGYSSTRIAMQLRPAGRLVSVECARTCVQWTQRMLRLASLDDRVDVLEGTISSRLEDLRAYGSFDLVFIDHDKDAYLSDLRLLEAHGLVRAGSVVVADNVLMNGDRMHGYLAHVRNPSGPYVTSTLYRSSIEYSTAKEVGPGDALEDGVEVSVYR